MWNWEWERSCPRETMCVLQQISSLDAYLNSCNTTRCCVVGRGRSFDLLGFFQRHQNTRRPRDRPCRRVLVWTDVYLSRPTCIFESDQKVLHEFVYNVVSCICYSSVFWGNFMPPLFPPGSTVCGMSIRPACSRLYVRHIVVCIPPLYGQCAHD